jgi:hypothetical protein
VATLPRGHTSTLRWHPFLKVIPLPFLKLAT